MNFEAALSCFVRGLFVGCSWVLTVDACSLQAAPLRLRLRHCARRCGVAALLPGPSQILGFLALADSYSLGPVCYYDTVCWSRGGMQRAPHFFNACELLWADNPNNKNARAGHNVRRRRVVIEFGAQCRRTDDVAAAIEFAADARFA